MHLSEKQLNRITDCSDITTINPSELIRLFRNENEISKYLPEQHAELDPRSDEYVIFNSKRAARPADNKGSSEKIVNECVICSGRTTGVVDTGRQTNGYTFINKNLFPILYPFETSSEGSDSSGFHFLQWTSSNHNDNWTNMKATDLAVVFGRLAAVEGWLLSNVESFFPLKKKGWVSIIKNFGKKVGGSLEHDHQQIGFSSVMPGRVRQNIDFYQRHNEKFSKYMLRTNPEKLILHDYGAAKLIVPFFMKRPLNMMLVLKDSGKDFLHELSSEEILAVALAWSDAITLITQALPEMGCETAYNVIAHTGTGIYFEFLPFTQEMGGFEHIGLYLCQMTPEQAYKILKTKFENRRV